MAHFTRSRARGRGGWFHNRRGQHATDVAASPSPPVGKLIENISESDIHDEHAESTERLSITNTKLIASYNWLDGSSTIAIPGLHYPKPSVPLAELC
jgi:hypothetical protein